MYVCCMENIPATTKIFEYLLPKEMVAYFTLAALKQEGDKLTLVLEEKNIIPDEHKDKKVESKGFYPSSKIEDFPIREYKVYLEVRRRKWIDLDTGKLINRTWELTAKGTSYTKEFGAFLKEMVRYLPC